MRSLLCLALVSMLGCSNDDEVKALRKEVEALKTTRDKGSTTRGTASGSGRAVVELFYDSETRIPNEYGSTHPVACMGAGPNENGELLYLACSCPDGFSHVGWKQGERNSGSHGFHAVCLEDSAN